MGLVAAAPRAETPPRWRLEGVADPVLRQEYEEALKAMDDLLTCGSDAELRIATALNGAAPEVVYIGIHKKRSTQVLKRLYVKRQELR